MMAHLIYKLLLIGTVAGTFSACGGGFDDLDAARAGGAGIGSTVTEPTDPNEPEVRSNWLYKTFEMDNRVFSLRADNYALNTYQRPDYQNSQARPWIQLEKNLDYYDQVTESVTIFVLSTTPCTPSCDVGIKFDGNRATYRMRNSIDGVLEPIDRSTEIALFKKFTTSNEAVVSLPIIGLSNPFDAEFDLRGYDMQRMSF